jgi:hypothetical protein
VRRAPLAIALLALAGCRSKRKHDDPMPEPPVVPNTPIVVDAAKPWPELEGYTRVQPERVIALPARNDVPRFDLGGPAIAGDLAVVSSSQFGFVAVDWRKGTVAWSKPAGTHVAPPLVLDRGIVLIGDCVNPPAVPDREQLVGCLRVVTPAGTDQAYIAVHGRPKAVEAFVAERGAQRLVPDGDRTVRWIRGEAAIAIDLVTGVSRAADATPPPIAIAYKDRTWDIAHVDGRIVGYTGGTKKVAWTTEYRYSALVGAVWLPEMGPMIRVANAGAFRDAPEIHLIDIDATGSLRAQVAKPAPGVGVLAHAVSSVGDAALAVRVDNSLRRDLVVAYSANAMLQWVYPLPEQQRADPIGIAISGDADAVVVFHDGDTVTVLPDLSAAPTTPGAARASSKKPTP